MPRTLLSGCTILLFACVSHVADAQPAAQLVQPAQSAVHPYSLDRVTQRTLYSKTGRRFQVSIALPQAPSPPGGYPVLYVLDPQTSFGTLTETVRNHESMFGPVIVVGVGYETEAEQRNRMFDLTPPGTRVDSLPAMFREGSGPLGGAAAFLAFIKEDVMPAVGATAHVDANRQAIFGHSLGGLFVLYVLFTQPETFDTYIAGSASIWWSNKLVLSDLPAFKARLTGHALHKRLLMTMGALEYQTNPEELRLIRQMKLVGAEDLPQAVDMLGNAAALAHELKPLAAQGLDVQYVVFPEETHNSVIPAFLGRGARFTLSGWYR
ncbi:MAG TPA: alpha/beta hydrolase-fold protein [Steroidobacteraceae bacterium]|nr:alpha/beta hydrolase-fold protein [Steroidobacteraceae bacterium]